MSRTRSTWRRRRGGYEAAVDRSPAAGCPVRRNAVQQPLSAGLYRGAQHPSGAGGGPAETGDWEEAHVLTEQALTQWQSRDSYLHILLRHSDTDQIYTGFQEVLEFLTCQEAGEYSAANARLMTQISLLYEAEQFTLKNVL